jgi:hypothetical protein
MAHLKPKGFSLSCARALLSPLFLIILSLVWPGWGQNLVLPQQQRVHPHLRALGQGETPSVIVMYRENTDRETGARVMQRQRVNLHTHLPHVGISV